MVISCNLVHLITLLMAMATELPLIATNDQVLISRLSHQQLTFSFMFHQPFLILLFHKHWFFVQLIYPQRQGSNVVWKAFFTDNIENGKAQNLRTYPPAPWVPGCEGNRCCSDVPVCLMSGFQVFVSIVSDGQASRGSEAQV